MRTKQPRPKEPALSRPRSMLVVLTVLAVLSPRIVFAQQQGDAAMPWGVGLGVATMKRPYAGADAKKIVFPLLSFENEYVKLTSTGFDLKLASAGTVN
jgi:outer membrane scaffolding protein for murein synthesis (MipA/OmpV family)